MQQQQKKSMRNNKDENYNTKNNDTYQKQLTILGKDGSLNNRWQWGSEKEKEKK